MLSRRLAPFAACSLAMLSAGCAISDPYTHASSSAGSTVASARTAVPERDGPPPPSAPSRLPDGAASPTPQAALARYGRLYVNWTAATLPAVERQLASISIGQARAQAQAEARTALQTLARYAVANTGQVVAVAQGLGAERGRWAVITNEQTSGDGPYQGLPATSHVTWATAARVAGSWVVSGWYPGS